MNNSKITCYKRPMYNFVKGNVPLNKHIARLTAVRFRGISIGRNDGFSGSAGAAALESLQIPREFYLPEAVGKEESSKGKKEEDDGGGFLSFGGGSMDVEAS